jgi:hypothetical protein
VIIKFKSSKVLTGAGVARRLTAFEVCNRDW